MKLVIERPADHHDGRVAESTLLAAKLGFTPEAFWGALDGGPLAAILCESQAGDDRGE